MAEIYTVIVPDGVGPGDSFQTMVGNDIVHLTCPTNARSGAALTLNVEKRAEAKRVDTTTETGSTAGMIRRQNVYLPTVWMFLDILLFVLFTLACTLPTFAIQSVSKSCLVKSPFNNKPVSSLYYSLYRGLGTESYCSTTSNNVCLKWSDRNVWDTFDALTVNLSGYALSSTNISQNTWLVAQVLIPIAAVCCLFAAFLHVYSQYKFEIDQAGIIALGGVFVIVSWVLGFVSINYVAYAPVVSSGTWKKFYSDGYNLINLVEGTNTVGPKPDSCSVSIFYVDAGVLLTVATPIAFFVTVAIVISGCCFLCFRIESSTNTMGSPKSIPPQPVIVYVDQVSHVERAEPVVPTTGEEKESSSAGGVGGAAATEPPVVGEESKVDTTGTFTFTVAEPNV